MVSIIGPSGSGKTTLVNLIPRFYDPNYGSIFIDGVDIKNISLKSLRRQIGIVHQDTFLFSNSILENIKYGNRNTSFEEIKKAATIADAHRFIIELPDKYETIIGERGAKLSGGQKQRIAIARAIIKNPKILILDEAISWLDNNSIETLKESLRFLRKKCTIILITHRRAIIENFYRIVVLEKGKVFEKLDEINSLQIFESYN
ncbi:MAG: ATP-binding cassette domain-containing protein [Candidatus Cloacimonetes bacterium]|nr:ATP-binding cassette domain-containing protein [Candidatus Cloacimonadota bacterium]